MPTEEQLQQQQLNLLLTVARVLRAQTRDRLHETKHDADLLALDDALAPYEGVLSTPVNEELNR